MTHGQRDERVAVRSGELARGSSRQEALNLPATGSVHLPRHSYRKPFAFSDRCQDTETTQPISTAIELTHAPILKYCYFRKISLHVSVMSVGGAIFFFVFMLIVTLPPDWYRLCAPMCALARVRGRNVTIRVGQLYRRSHCVALHKRYTANVSAGRSSSISSSRWILD
jgi:hypothetical protein